MDQPEAPSTPDPNQINRDQQRSNINAFNSQNWGNNANVYTPWGSSTFTPDGRDANGAIRYRQNVTLSPEMQRLFNTYTGAQTEGADSARRLLRGGLLDNPVNLNGLPDAPIADRQQYVDALNSRLEPQLERDRAAMESRLANQGIMPGSEAYREAIALSDRGRNDARTQAILQGGQYAQQEYGMSADARDRAVRERLLPRQQTLQEYATLMGRAAPNMPQFQGFQGGQIQPVNTSGNAWNAYNAQMNQYNQEMQQYNAMMGGIAGLGGTLLQLPMTGGGSFGGNMMGSMFGGLGG